MNFLGKIHKYWVEIQVPRRRRPLSMAHCLKTYTWFFPRHFPETFRSSSSQQTSWINPVGGFNPVEKNISQIGSFPQVGVKKNIWNHQLVTMETILFSLFLRKVKTAMTMLLYILTQKMWTKTSLRLKTQNMSSVSLVQLCHFGIDNQQHIHDMYMIHIHYSTRKLSCYFTKQN